MMEQKSVKYMINNVTLYGYNRAKYLEIFDQGSFP